MDKLKKILCCLWSTPTAILLATILYLYADRNEYIYLTEIDKELEYEPYIGEVIQVTNKWTGETCLALTALEDAIELNRKHSIYGLCSYLKTRDASSLYLP